VALSVERSHNDEYIAKELGPIPFQPAMEAQQPRLRSERVEFQGHPPGLLVGVNNRDWPSFVLDEVRDHFNRAADRLLYEVERRLLLHCDAKDPAVRFDRANESFSASANAKHFGSNVGHAQSPASWRDRQAMRKYELSAANQNI
jgi:hypothetical protein